MESKGKETEWGAALGRKVKEEIKKMEGKWKEWK